MRRAAVFILVGILAATAAAQRPSGLKRGPWRDGDAPDGWTRLVSGRYEFQSNVPIEKVKAVAKHLNAVYDHYARTFPSGRTPNKPFAVKIFKNRDEFLAYGAPPSAGAYYSWSDKEMVGYDTGKLDGVMDTAGTTGPRKPRPLDAVRARMTMDLLGVFAHEGWHQYFHWWCTSKISFPSWCDEGIGEYFYTARFREGKVVLGDPNDYRLGTIQAAIKAKKHIPLKDSSPSTSRSTTPSPGSRTPRDGRSSTSSSNTPSTKNSATSSASSRSSSTSTPSRTPSRRSSGGWTGRRPKRTGSRGSRR